MTPDAPDDLAGRDLLLLDDAVWLLVGATGHPAYDFAVDRFLPCRRPYDRPSAVTAIARVGAPADYARFHAAAAAAGITLAHTPAQHARCSTLSGWYPRLTDLTARSEVFDQPPPPDVVAARFGWPVFLKGERQTSRHRRDLAVLRDPAAYVAACATYARDPILAWQRVALREYLALRPVAAPADDRIPPSFEFRVFLWRGAVVGFGRYWWEAPAYACTPAEQAAAEALAVEAARRVAVPFLVVDVAQRVDGRWVVIECNDGQESGFAGVSPFALWQALAARERAAAGA